MHNYELQFCSGGCACMQRRAGGRAAAPLPVGDQRKLILRLCYTAIPLTFRFRQSSLFKGRPCERIPQRAAARPCLGSTIPNNLFISDKQLVSASLCLSG